MSTDLTEEDLNNKTNTKMSEIDKNQVETSTDGDSTSEITQPTEAAKAPQKKKKAIPICNICREKVTKETYIRCPICKQFFCKFCVEDWLISVRNNRICPLCAKKWDDNFICNNLPLGFVVNTLKLRVDGLYSSDYEYDTQHERMHDTDETDDEEEHEDDEEHHEEDEHENHDEEHEESHENHDEERHREHEEHHDESHRTNRERLLDFILNADAIGEDQESINLVRMLLLSDLLDH